MSHFKSLQAFFVIQLCIKPPITFCFLCRHIFSDLACKKYFYRGMVINKKNKSEYSCSQYDILAMPPPKTLSGWPCQKSIFAKQKFFHLSLNNLGIHVYLCTTSDFPLLLRNSLYSHVIKKTRRQNTTFCSKMAQNYHHKLQSIAKFACDLLE